MGFFICLILFLFVGVVLGCDIFEYVERDFLIYCWLWVFLIFFLFEDWMFDVDFWCICVIVFVMMKYKEK